MSFMITEECTSCAACVEDCPNQAIEEGDPDLSRGVHRAGPGPPGEPRGTAGQEGAPAPRLSGRGGEDQGPSGGR